MRRTVGGTASPRRRGAQGLRRGVGAPLLHRGRRIRVTCKTVGGSEKPQQKPKKPLKDFRWRDGALIMASAMHACVPSNILAHARLTQGDAVMLMATELSSQRVVWNKQMALITGIAVVSWFIAASCLGDYRWEDCRAQNSSSLMEMPLSVAQGPAT